MRRSAQSAIVALALSASVLGVFYTHQWYGPVGALQHYLYATIRGDRTVARSLTDPPTDLLPPAYQRAVSIDLQTRSYDPVRGKAIVQSVVFVPIGTGKVVQTIPILWDLRSTKDGWKINVEGTNELNMGRPN